MTAHNFQTLSIRDIEKISEMRTVEELQKEVWGIDDREVYPALAMVPMRQVGGILIGAFDGDRMIGFVFGFPGVEKGRRILHSDMLAVRSEYRSRGVGYKLKLAQRERALAKGIDTITWTFDPLQAANAHLNFAKLGVIADRYLVNYYGETTSFLHSTGTDRLWVTWSLNSERVKERIHGDSAMKVPPHDGTPTVVRVADNDEPFSVAEELSAQMFIEVPKDINRLLKQNVGLATRWRAVTRAAFTETIGAGFIVTDFFLSEGHEGRVGRYLLTAKRSKD